MFLDNFVINRGDFFKIVDRGPLQNHKISNVTQIILIDSNIKNITRLGYKYQLSMFLDDFVIDLYINKSINQNCSVDNAD